MRHLDEYREAAMVRRWAAAVAGIATRPWTLMEICGGQTHAILQYGLDALLPPGVRFLHGPGCPVCVTPADLIDQATDLARRPDITLCSFGDMLRVPGRRGDLLAAKAAGGFGGQQVSAASRHAQHVAEGAERDVRPARQIGGLIDQVGRRDADRTAWAVEKAHAGREQCVESVLKNGVGLPPAYFHQRPR